MKFDEYQKCATSYAVYPDVGHNFVYPTIGLAGETGEVAEKVKKLIRDGGGIVTPAFRSAIAAELGDVLWYVSQMAWELELGLDAVAKGNLDKLRGRVSRGTMSGSGDDR